MKRTIGRDTAVLIAIGMISFCGCRRNTPIETMALPQSVTPHQNGPSRASPTAVALRKRLGVPEDYVVTPAGYFHPSCVNRLASGEHAMKGNVVTDATGKTRIITRCTYPHFTRTGRRIEVNPTSPRHFAPRYIEHDYVVLVSQDLGGSGVVQLSSKWTVPGEPVGDDGQVLYYFPALEPSDYSVIIQPVLGWQGQWSISAWEYSDAYGISTQSSPINVNVGDVIDGQLSGSNCDSTGRCASWDILAHDITLNQQTWVDVDDAYITSPLPTLIGGALEVYDVNSCGDYATSPVVFDNWRITRGDGGGVSTSWAISTTTQSPECGWNATTSGLSVTIAPPPPPPPPRECSDSRCTDTSRCYYCACVSACEPSSQVCDHVCGYKNGSGREAK